MGASIRYSSNTGQTLDDKVAVFAKETPELIQKSLRPFNTKAGDKCPAEGLKELSQIYAPISTEEGKQALPFPALYSVFAYDMRKKQLVGAGLLVNGILTPNPDTKIPQFEQKAGHAVIYGIYVDPYSDPQNAIRRNILDKLIKYAREGNVTNVQAITADFDPLVLFYRLIGNFGQPKEAEFTFGQHKLKLQELHRVLTSTKPKQS